MTTPVRRNAVRTRRSIVIGIKAQDLLGKAITTLILAAGAVVIFIPLMFMFSTSLKDRNQLRRSPPPLIPLEYTMVEVDGKEEPLYEVTVEGEARQMALIKNLPEGKGVFVDPANPDQTLELVIAEQEQMEHLEMHWENYPEALTSVPFDKYLVNTLIVITLGMAGMLISSTMVAYGFSRFRAPYLNVLFVVLLSTIMLPSQVRLIPMYVFLTSR